jgi:hypothetical protein
MTDAKRLPDGSDCVDTSLLRIKTVNAANAGEHSALFVLRNLQMKRQTGSERITWCYKRGRGHRLIDSDPRDPPLLSRISI